MNQHKLRLAPVSNVEKLKRPRSRPAKKPKLSRAGLVGGTVLGGFVPVSSYTLVHSGNEQAALWSLPMLLVLGGLLYSAPTVWEWARSFCGPVKAFGFVLLLEGILVASPVPWLAAVALVLLAAVNALVLATKLGTKRAEA